MHEISEQITRIRPRPVLLEFASIQPCLSQNQRMPKRAVNSHQLLKHRRAAILAPVVPSFRLSRRQSIQSQGLVYRFKDFRGQVGKVFCREGFCGHPGIHVSVIFAVRKETTPASSPGGCSGILAKHKRERSFATRSSPLCWKITGGYRCGVFFDEKVTLTDVSRRKEGMTLGKVTLLMEPPSGRRRTKKRPFLSNSPSLSLFPLAVEGCVENAERHVPSD